MALTLIEAAKKATGDVVKQAIIELYAKSSDVLRTLPFENIEGNALKYTREQTLPGVAFRGVNGSYNESTGVLNPQTEALSIAGGDLDVDKFIVDTMGVDARAVHEAMKVKALSLNMTKTFIKGDSASDPTEFDGLQVRVTGDQLVAAGSTANGDPLSLSKLDELIDNIDDPQYLAMSKAMRRKLTVAARTAAVGGDIQYVLDEFGRQVTMYNGLPVLLIDKDETNTDILGFNETCPGGGTSTGTSIYCVSYSEGMVTGIQNGGIDVRDLGELQSKPALRTRVEWYLGIAIYNSKGVGRLWGISDATVTA